MSAFKPGEKIKMRVTEKVEKGGTRTFFKKFVIDKAELSKPSWHWKYTLLTVDGDLYQGGEWITEYDLRPA